MKLKTGKDVLVVGEVALDGKHYAIVNLQTAKYVIDNVPVRYVLVPVSQFEREIKFDE